MSRQLSFPIRGDKLSMSAEVLETVASVRSDFQLIEVVDTSAFGRALLLDGHIQLTTLDEHAYHESLVQFPLLSMKAPKRALVIGGGDGGVLRELCKDPRLEAIHMVEIDRAVIETCREHLPELSAGAFDDPRVEVFVQDAFPFVKGVETPYDLIVADSTDTYEGEDGNLSEALFTVEFYRDCARALSTDGLLVTQADNLLFCPYSLDGILETFRKAFPRTGSYWAVVPSFGGFSGYAWASHRASLQPDLNRAGSRSLRYVSSHSIAMGLGKLPFESPSHSD